MNVSELGYNKAFEKFRRFQWIDPLGIQYKASPPPLPHSQVDKIFLQTTNEVCTVRFNDLKKCNHFIQVYIKISFLTQFISMSLYYQI